MNEEIKTIRLVYEDPNTGMLCIVHPTGETSLEYIINNAIPKDFPYWQINESFIPEDRSFRDAWELDVDYLGEPDGVGGAEL
jgi:hypothetical protein